MLILAQFVISFFVVFLKAVQTQTVVKGSKKLAFIVSILMTLVNTTNIILIVENTWASVLPIAVGSGLGVISAMYLYRRLESAN